MHALGNKVFIDPKIEYVSKGGIIIPQQGFTSTAPERGLVVSVGPLCEELKAGDFVIFEKGKGLDIIDEKNNRNLLIMRETDVQAIL